MATILTPQIEARLRAGLRAVCAAADLSADGAELIKYTINAVYRLATAPVVVRLSSGDRAATRAQKVVEVAGAFESLDVPTVRLAPGVTKPVRRDEWVATFWTLLPQAPGRQYLPVDLAPPLRRIHAIEPGAELPTWDTVGEAISRLDRVADLPPEHLDYTREWARTMVGADLDVLIRFLRDWANQLDRELHEITWQLDSGVIHGDARLGNLLDHPDGHTVLCDLDSVCTGPREWDLTPAAFGLVRFGQDPARYHAFVDTYGFDLTRWEEGWHLLRQTRELKLLTSVIGSLDGRPAVAEQLAHRLRTVLDGDTGARWESYQ